MGVEPAYGDGKRPPGKRRRGARRAESGRGGAVRRGQTCPTGAGRRQRHRFGSTSRRRRRESLGDRLRPLSGRPRTSRQQRGIVAGDRAFERRYPQEPARRGRHRVLCRAFARAPDPRIGAMLQRDCRVGATESGGGTARGCPGGARNCGSGSLSLRGRAFRAVLLAGAAVWAGGRRARSLPPSPSCSGCSRLRFWRSSAGRDPLRRPTRPCLRLCRWSRRALLSRPEASRACGFPPGARVRATGAWLFRRQEMTLGESSGA